MDKGLHPPFPEESDLGIFQNYLGITLTSISAKIYNALLLNRFESEIEKNQNGFHRNRCIASNIPLIRWILDVREKTSKHSILIHRFLLGIWLHTQREDWANTSSQRSTQGVRRSHNDAL